MITDSTKLDFSIQRYVETGENGRRKNVVMLSCRSKKNKSKKLNEYGKGDYKETYNRKITFLIVKLVSTDGIHDRNQLWNFLVVLIVDLLDPLD